MSQSRLHNPQLYPPNFRTNQSNHHHHNILPLPTQHPSTMHAPSISGMRTAMLSGRLTSKTLGPFAHPSSCTNPLYQALSQTRTASTSSMRVRSTQTLKPTTALRPSTTTTQLPSSLVLRRANSSAAAAAKSETVRLDWDSFFKLRASRRRYSLASSIVSSLFTTVIGVQVLSTQDLESLGAQVMGLDPFVVLGMATAACGAAGWLVGPFVGNAVWGLVYRRYKPAVMVVSFFPFPYLSCY